MIGLSGEHINLRFGRILSTIVFWGYKLISDHFLFLQNSWVVYLNQSFANFIIGDTFVDAKIGLAQKSQPLTFVDAKTVLDNVKSSIWKFFKFWLSGVEVDKSYVFWIYHL